jgi:O-antigen ligase
VGPGQFSTLVQELDSSIDEPLDVHNTWLEVLCEIGWPGAILFSFFWSGLVLLSLLTIGKPSSDFVNPNTWNRIRVRLDETWEQRATLSFFLIYFVVGLFGSRHNLPLAYMLAGVGFSKIASVKRESD